MEQRTNTVAAAQEAGLAFNNHTATFNFKTFEVGSEKQKELAALVAAGKLSMDSIDEDKREDGSQTWKRKQLKTHIPVLDLLTVVREGALELPQVQHLQALLNGYVESKQKVNVDAGKHDEIIDCMVLLSGPYSQKKVAVKITAEMLAEALEVLASQLENLASDKVAKVIYAAAEKKFNATAVRGFSTPVLEKINGLVLEAYDALSDADKVKHEAVFVLFTDNLAAALEPQEAELSEDDFV